MSSPSSSSPSSSPRTRLLLALPCLGGLLAAPTLAHADWRGPGWGGPPPGWHHHRHGDATGAIVAGSLLALGLGIAALAATAPPAYAPPPPAYYPPPPPYAAPQPPGWYAPAPYAPGW